MMEKIPAQMGWLWVREGFALFRKQPAELSTLFFGYMFLMLALNIIPVIGQLLPLILSPLFSLSFMHAGAYIDRDKKVYPNLLLAGFRSPQKTTLIKLGTVQLLAAIFAVAMSSLVDDGVFFQAITGQLQMTEELVRSSNMTTAMFFAAAIYTPLTVICWFAAPLIGWQGMGLGKAIFYSFFSVRRAGKAFLVYGFAWLTIGMMLPVIASAVIGMIIGIPPIWIFTPLSLIMMVIMYCSVYATYKTLFGDPPEPLPS